jgi:hypothetical protein
MILTGALGGTKKGRVTAFLKVLLQHLLEPYSYILAKNTMNLFFGYIW